MLLKAILYPHSVTLHCNTQHIYFEQIERYLSVSPSFKRVVCTLPIAIVIRYGLRFAYYIAGVCIGLTCVNSNYSGIMMTEKEVKTFAEQLIEERLPVTFQIKGQTFQAEHGHGYAINNQGRNLKYNNLLSNKQEYILKTKGARIPISIQIYPNKRGQYMIYCYTNRGALFSINFNIARYYEEDVLLFRHHLKISTIKLSPEQREKNLQKILVMAEAEGVETDGKVVILGRYLYKETMFKDNDFADFLLAFTKLSIIKGHFMSNKGYEVKAFNK